MSTDNTRHETIKGEEIYNIIHYRHTCRRFNMEIWSGIDDGGGGYFFLSCCVSSCSYCCNTHQLFNMCLYDIPPLVNEDDYHARTRRAQLSLHRPLSDEIGDK